VYQARAELSARLIEDGGVSGIVIEADWPDAWRVDRCVRGIGPDKTATEALGEFDDFPDSWPYGRTTRISATRPLRKSPNARS
jgi:erythromycin esterase-like protein